jgi:hypothetical protein
MSLVNGLEKAKDIWDTLQRAHEGTKPVKKAKRQLIEGQLDRFVLLDDEDPREIYNRLKKLVNKVRAYGSKRWGDRRVIDRMLRAYICHQGYNGDILDSTRSYLQEDDSR